VSAWLVGGHHAAMAVADEIARIEADPDNPASQRVITANGGVLVERFVTAAAYGCRESLRFRIDL